MRCLLVFLFLWSGITSTVFGAAQGSQAKIVKVLPTLLDQKGRNSLSPSLYERDAYQSVLRKNRDRVAGMRFDVQWKAGTMPSRTVVLRLELRTRTTADGNPVVIDTEVASKRFGTKWSRVVVNGEDFKRVGEVVAWRATLVDKGETLAQRTSFLW